MLVSLTVGKVDAGVAVLLTQDNRLVSSRFPLCAAIDRETSLASARLLQDFTGDYMEQNEACVKLIVNNR